MPKMNAKRHRVKLIFLKYHKSMIIMIYYLVVVKLQNNTANVS